MTVAFMPSLSGYRDAAQRAEDLAAQLGIQ